MKKTKIMIFLSIFICIAGIFFTETNDSPAAGAIENQVQPGSPKAVMAQKAFTFNEVLVPPKGSGLHI